MKKNDLVSIIIPCYNQAQYLKESVQSAIKQTYPNIEIIIINDGSPDNTSQVAEGLQKRYPNIIRVVNQENQGLSKARNTGIRESLGKYIIPLDADDKLDKEMTRHCMNEMIKNNTDIVYGGLQCFEEKSDIWISKPFSENNILYKNLPHQSSLYRKKVWAKVNGYKQNMQEGYEDWEFWINAYKNNFRFYYLPKVLYYYRIKEVSRETNAKTKHTYLFNKIILNHPELYTTEQVQKAISQIKDTESLADLYFYSSEDLPINKEFLANAINQYLTSNELQESQFIDIPKTSKKINLYTLDVLENPKKLYQLQKDSKADFILFYAPLRYKVSSLKNLNFAWSKNRGTIDANGTIFQYVYKSDRENPTVQLAAYKYLVQYQNMNLQIQNTEIQRQVQVREKKDKLIQEKDRGNKNKDKLIQENNKLIENLYEDITKRNLQYKEIINSIKEITKYSIKTKPLDKYKAYKAMIQTYHKLK